MTLFRNVVFVAAIAGLLAGIVMTAMQAYATVPLILQAETFENAEAAPVHDHAAPADTATPQQRRKRQHLPRMSMAKKPGRQPTASSAMPIRPPPMSSPQSASR